MAELKEMYQIFTECWRFYKKFTEMERTEDVWRYDITAEAKLIGDSHKGNFAKKLVLLTMEQLKLESGYENRLEEKNESKENNM